MQENCELKKRNGLVGLSEPASLFYNYLRELPYELIKSVS